MVNILYRIHLQNNKYKKQTKQNYTKLHNIHENVYTNQRRKVKNVIQEKRKACL